MARQIVSKYPKERVLDGIDPPVNRDRIKKTMKKMHSIVCKLNSTYEGGVHSFLNRLLKGIWKKDEQTGFRRTYFKFIDKLMNGDFNGTLGLRFNDRKGMAIEKNDKGAVTQWEWAPYI